MPATVSIITPAFRAAAYISETIRSVVAQSWQDWEMIVVDDCSPDDTAAVVEEFSRRDGRIRLLRQPRNAGPAAARDAALRAAQGRYLAFLDSDDLWLPDKLAHQLDFMRRHDAALSYTQFRRISHDGSRTGELVRIPSRLTYRQLLANTAISTSSAMVDREKSGPLSMTRTYYDDFVLWLSILKRGHVAHGLQEDLMRYRVVGGSVSRNKLRSVYWVWRTYRDIEGLSFFAAVGCLLAYAARALFKYRAF